MTGVAMIIESELRDEMARAVGSAQSLSDLYHWLMSRSWNMHRDSAPAAVELAAEVEAILLERADGIVSDAEARLRIINLLNNVVVSQPIEVTSDEQQYFRHASSARWVAQAVRLAAA